MKMASCSRVLLIAAAMSSLMAASATASTITLDFDVGNNGSYPYINDYYAGGTLSNGVGPGLDYGVTFTNAQTLYYNDANQMFFPLDSGGAIYMNVAGGFDSFLSFHYGWPGYQSTPTVSIWSGLDGTGDLLGSISLSSNGTYYTSENPAIELDFSGIAHSAVFSGTANFVTWDTVSFNVDGSNVPEPATLGLAGLALAGLGFGRRKRTV